MSRKNLFLFFTAIALTASGTPLLAEDKAEGGIFSADSTTRESVMLHKDGSMTALSAPSESLRFQISPKGQTFLAFVSQDPDVDGTSHDDFYSDKCHGTNKNVYWIEKGSHKPAVCVSTNYKGYTPVYNTDATNPFIAGADNDAGRYVAYEALVNNGSDDVQQLFIHDRKWEESWVSAVMGCFDNFAPTNLPNGDSKLYGFGSDAKKLLFSSSATENIQDNLDPKCDNSFFPNELDPSLNVFVPLTRDGSSCKENYTGFCKTNVHIDHYGLHSSEGLVNENNKDVKNLRMSDDEAKVIVFDSVMTDPVHFQPDVLGYNDVFTWSDNIFTMISQKMQAYFNELGEISFLSIAGPANGNSQNPDVDKSGTIIVYDSYATDLVCNEERGVDMNGDCYYVSNNGHRQIYLYNVNTYKTELISVNPDGKAGNGDSEHPFISDDGRFVVFETKATDLVKDIVLTGKRNIVVYDRGSKKTFLATPGYIKEGSGSVLENGLVEDARITDVSPSGLTIAYQTKAFNATNPDVDPAGPIKPINNKVNGLEEYVQNVFLAKNNCPQDTDLDGTPDCIDLCVQDPQKTEPGQCGCEVADTDTDLDGVADCNDTCKDDPSKVEPGQCGCGVEDKDSDGDGTPDCIDECKGDPNKVEAGACGCGIPDEDKNGNGTPDCLDPDPSYVPMAPYVKVVTNKKGVKVAKVSVNPSEKYQDANIKYTFIVKNKGTKKTKTITSNKTTVKFKKMAKGKYFARYSMKAGNTVTQKGKKFNFVVR